MSLSSWLHKFSICFRNICTYIWILLTLKLTPTYQCDFRHQRSDLPVTYVLMSDMFDTPGHRGIEILILTVNPDAQLHWTVC